jgi:hypothetical protein
VDTREVPDHVLDQLLVGLVFHEADLTLTHYAARGKAVISDAFGTVFSWLWQQSPVKATILIADLLAELRFHHPTATTVIELEAVLRALAPALRGVPSDEVTAIQKQLRRDVPLYVGPSEL